mmetsp:Transcript_15842/g.39547  ORF Transcript_15842/g.39547 Transcript_15842/m.39547 type:complete len:343 (-) Transcript_15842:166-1194(-)
MAVAPTASVCASAWDTSTAGPATAVTSAACWGGGASAASGRAVASGAAAASVWVALSVAGAGSAPPREAPSSSCAATVALRSFTASASFSSLSASMSSNRFLRSFATPASCFAILACASCALSSSAPSLSSVLRMLSTCSSSDTTSDASALARSLLSTAPDRVPSRSRARESSASICAPISDSYFATCFLRSWTTLPMLLKSCVSCSFSLARLAASLLCCSMPRCISYFSCVRSSMYCCSSLNWLDGSGGGAGSRVGRLAGRGVSDWECVSGRPSPSGEEAGLAASTGGALCPSTCAWRSISRAAASACPRPLAVQPDGGAAAASLPVLLGARGREAQESGW